MHARAMFWVITFTVLGALVPAAAQAQSATNLYALRGLAPVSVLLNTAAGRAALASNYTVTGAIQTGAAHLPALQPFAQQQELALKDAFITSGNARELADGLGTTLGNAYQSAVQYTSTDDGATSRFTNVSPNVATLIGYTNALTAADSASGKYFFANETVVTKTATTPVSKNSADVIAAAGGTTDVFGKAYHHPAGSPGADPFGDSRPFQTEVGRATFSASDYFGVTATNDAYLSGPTQTLVASPSFPSGHTTYGYTEALLLAILVPARYEQMVARGAEYGTSRIVLGAHYAMDVIAGRTLASFDIAQLLAQNPDYVGQPNGAAGIGGAVTITDFFAAVSAAKFDLTTALESSCGNTIAMCATQDTSRFRDAATDEAAYEATQTYGLPVVYAATAHAVEDVAAIAPEAGYLLTAAFPNVTLAQADQILTQTEGPGGGFLDNTSAFGLYSRLDLYRAAKAAALLSAKSQPHP